MYGNRDHHPESNRGLDDVLTINKKGGSRTSFFQKGEHMSSVEKKVLLLFIIVLIDSLATVYLISSGLVYSELNPIFEWIRLRSDVTFMIMVKIALSLFLLIAIIKNKYLDKHINWAIPAYLFILFGGVAIQLII
jgi:hypothetical protein